MNMRYLTVLLILIFQLSAEEWVYIHGLAQEKPFSKATIHTFTPRSLLEGNNQQYDIVAIEEIYNDSDAQTIYELFKSHFAHFLYIPPTAKTPGNLILTKYSIGPTKSLLEKDPVPHISSTFLPIPKRPSPVKTDSILLCGVLENDDYDPPVKEQEPLRDSPWNQDRLSASAQTWHFEDGSWEVGGGIKWERPLGSHRSVEVELRGTYYQDRDGSRAVGGQISGTWGPPDRDK